MAERVTFPSCTGPTLTGVIDRPDGAIRGWGVFSHGFTLGKDCPAAARICRQLAKDGIAMMRFDALGLGDSDGDWGDGSFTLKANDVIAACTFMAERGTLADIHRAFLRWGRGAGGRAGLPRCARRRHRRGADGPRPCRNPVRRRGRDGARRGQVAMKTRGAERAQERAELRAAYEAGASVRTLAATHGHSYGYVHDALAQTGTQLRGRGGPNNVVRSAGQSENNSQGAISDS